MVVVRYYTRKQVWLELVDAVASNLGLDDSQKGKLSRGQRIISHLSMDDIDLVQLAYDIGKLFVIPESDLKAVIEKERDRGYQPCVHGRPDFTLGEIHRYLCSHLNL